MSSNSSTYIIVPKQQKYNLFYDASTTKPCSGCFYILCRNEFSDVQWEGDEKKLRYCNHCIKHGPRRGNIISYE